MIILRILFILAALGGVFGILYWYAKRQLRRRDEAWEKAIEEFNSRKEMLEAKFFDIASESGIPRDMIWIEAEFQSDVVFAKNTVKEQLTALVEVKVRFEAVEGGMMEDMEAVSNVRIGSAILFFHGTEWSSSGRVVFNLTPKEAVEHFHPELEIWAPANEAPTISDMTIDKESKV